MLMSAAIAAATLFGATVADFHLGASTITPVFSEPRAKLVVTLVYLPSNNYNCPWVKTAGHGKGSEVTQRTPEGHWPDNFTSRVPICGAEGLQFHKNSDDGYDLIQNDGVHVGSCFRNFGGDGLNCPGFPFYMWKVFENYVCYSYLCNP